MLRPQSLPDVAFGEDENDYVHRMIAGYRSDYPMMQIAEVAKARYRQIAVSELINQLNNCTHDIGSFQHQANMRDAVVMLLKKVYEL